MKRTKIIEIVKKIKNEKLTTGDICQPDCQGKNLPAGENSGDLSTDDCQENTFTTCNADNASYFIQFANINA